MQDLTIGHLGPYQLIAPLGKGNMAVVYKATRPGLTYPIALKVLPRELAADLTFAGRFKQEARIIAQLNHPNILPLLDYGASEGHMYIAMPLAERGTLAAYLTGTPQPLEMVQGMILQIGSALEYAHTRGVVHRDVKPSNVLIDEGGRYLLTDFGIAKVLIGSAQFTVAGAAVGTPTYMSPEQALGRPVDGRSDIYSLGIILYQMMAGRPPFQAKRPVALAMKHINDPLPPPRNFNRHLPIEVERIIVKSLAKKPEDRFATAGEMVRMLLETTEAKG